MTYVMEKNKQQTAVKWLQQIALTRDLNLADFEQAKQMEKEQIKDAFVNGFCNDNESINADEIFYITRYGVREQ